MMIYPVLIRDSEEVTLIEGAISIAVSTHAL